MATTLQIVLPDELDQLRAGRGLLLVAADDVDQVVAEQRAELVEHRQLAAVLVAGIDRQHALARQRRLQQQVPQIAGEHFDGVRLGLFGQLAAGLALQARQHQPRERIAHAADQEILVRMFGRHQQFDGQLLDRRLVGLDLHAQHLRPLAAIDRQHAMRRNAMQRLAEIEVVVKLLILLLVVFDLRAHQLARLAIQLADLLPQLGIFAELLGQDVPGAQQRRGRVGHALVGVDEVGRPRVEIGARLVLGQNLFGQRAQALLAGLGGERLLLRPIRQVQIFEPLHAVGPLDLLAAARR